MHAIIQYIIHAGRAAENVIKDHWGPVEEDYSGVWREDV